MIEHLAPEQDVVISSRVRLARNYMDTPFFPKITQDQAEAMIARAQSALEGDEAAGYHITRMVELNEHERKGLVEHHLISYDLLKFAEWSAAMISSSKDVSVMINEEDHLRIQGLLPGLQLERAAELAFEADDRLSRQGKYAFDAQWGYLTSCPTNAGTGMRASTMLHLPALSATGQINAIVQAIAKLGMTVRGLYGEGSDAVGCLFQVSNQVTLGRSEEDIIRSLVAATMQLTGRERQVRQQMFQRDEVGVSDKLWRSVGILKSARIITGTELMPRMSDLRMAVTSGLIDFPLPKIDQLMQDLQSSSLTASIGEDELDRARDIRRAEILREALSGI